jgi:hypothetical protein
MKTLKTILAASLIMIGDCLMSQSTGIIKGIVADEKGTLVYLANIKLFDDSLFVSGVTSDEKGNFTFKDLTPGEYNLEVSFIGLTTNRINKVKADPFQVAYVNTKLLPLGDTLKTVVVTATYETTAVNPIYTTMTAIRLDQIENIALGHGDIIGIITALTPAVLPAADGMDFHVRGSRVGSNLYIIDGNKIMGSPEVPGLFISSMEVLTGGIPAEYGDCTGGVVIINTKDYKTEMRRKEMARREREGTNQ